MLAGGRLESPPGGWIEQFGQEVVTAGCLLRHGLSLRLRPGELLYHVYLFGTRSLPLVMIASIFAGAVSAWQASYQFQGHIPAYYLGTAVFKAVIIEVAPVMTAMIIAGRVGAAISAEIATMKFTEQLDALTIMRIPVVAAVGLPRVLALWLSMPFLLVFADLSGLLGGYLTSVSFLGSSPASFWQEIPAHFHLHDIGAGFIKAQVFAILIGIVATSAGFSADRSSAGVGKATVRSFVTAVLYILVANFITAVLLF
ncbi:MAG: ABC transporter permease [Candidatus Delongbacteria bacterium]|nr:ABC transporter permease [Candidatus Delongbacteria bacterium]